MMLLSPYLSLFIIIDADAYFRHTIFFHRCFIIAD